MQLGLIKKMINYNFSHMAIITIKYSQEIITLKMFHQIKPNIQMKWKMIWLKLQLKKHKRRI